MATRTRSRARQRPFRPEVPDLDERIAAEARDAIVVWRGEPIAFEGLPERITRTDDRRERDGMYAGWIEVLDALNPLYEARLARWRASTGEAGADDLALAAAGGRDLERAALEVERLAIQSETVYYAALRRYLALIDIEQGDATLADLWHIVRGAAWSHWFGAHELARAAIDIDREIVPGAEHDGWRSAEAGLAGEDALADVASPAAAVAEVYGTLVGDPAWLQQALRMAANEIGSFADFVGFVRLWRLRRALALTQYELRLYRSSDPAVQRAYYAGIVGHATGISVPEAAYLHEVGAPFSALAQLERTMLAGAIGETIVARHGDAWWSDGSAREWLREIAAAPDAADALAHLGYDALDWRPVLRQIRTRLIGEMSGYGGPNITTRAGTRKV